MSNTKIRKLIPVGNSLAVTLPPEWITKNQLKEGDKIKISWNGIVIIQPLKNTR